MPTIKDLGLTESDFDMLVEGLEALPNKSVAGEMMGDLLGIVLSEKSDPEQKMKMEMDIAVRRKKSDEERKRVIEDVRILQGKLIGLKRWMRENSLMADVEEILQRKS